MRFCFVHAADLHLDTPFTGLGMVPPEIRPLLRDASLIAFDNLVGLAIERGAAFVLLAGGIYDGPELGLRAQVRFRHGLERLANRGIHVFLVASEREQPGDWAAIREWPPNVTWFAPGATAPVPVVRDGQRLATIYGASGSSWQGTQGFDRVDAPGIHVGLLHVPGAPDEPPTSGMDYWALGGEHAAQILGDGVPWRVYPGTMQGRGPQPEELGPKGAMVVPVEDGVVGPPEFVSLAPVRILSLTLDIAGVPDLAKLREELLARAAALRAQHPVSGLILHVALHGDGAARGALLAGGGAAALLRDLRAQRWDGSPFVWWATLRDVTRPAGAVAAARGRSDFAAEVLRLAEELAADPARLREVFADRLTVPPDGALDHSSGIPEAADVADLLGDAAALAVDLLEERDRP